MSSDRIRKELAGIDPGRSAAAPYGTGLYAAAHTEATYGELLRRAEELLGRGESVVLDASWIASAHRTAAAELAARSGSALVQLECRAGADTARRRIRSRGVTPSDATDEVATAMAGAVDDWPDAVAVPTSGPLAESVRAAEAAWIGAARSPSGARTTAG